MGWFWCPKCDQPRKLDDQVEPNVCWLCRTPEAEGLYRGERWPTDPPIEDDK